MKGTQWIPVFSTIIMFYMGGALFAQDCNEEPEWGECICKCDATCELVGLHHACLELPLYQTPFWQFPGCPFSVLNNPSWVGFMARADTISMTITPNVCWGIGQGGQRGMQAVLYKGSPNDYSCQDCDPNEEDLELIRTQCECTEYPIEWSEIPLEVGEVYYLVIDGCAGDYCEVSITMHGHPVWRLPGELDELTYIDWPQTGFGGDTVCEGMNYLIVETDEIYGASSYVWTFPSGNDAITQENSVVIDLPNSGNYNICVFARNRCDSTNVICRDIIFAPLDTVEVPPQYICEGDVLNWKGIYIDTPGIYAKTVYNSQYCPYTNTIEVFQIEENEDDMTEVTFNICELDIIVYNGRPYYGNIQDSIIILENVSGCDSFINLTVNSHELPDCEYFTLETSEFERPDDSIDIYTALTTDLPVNCLMDFHLYLNDEFVGTFYLDSLNYAGTLPDDCSDYSMRASWYADNRPCNITDSIIKVICQDCILYDISVVTDSCTSDSTFLLFVNFEHQFTETDSFNLYGNGGYIETFSYQDLPVTVSEIRWNGRISDSIEICDNSGIACCAREFEIPACIIAEACMINELTAETVECTEDSFYILLDMIYDSIEGTNGFEVYGNGMDLGDFAYSEVPITIGPFPREETQWEFVVQDHKIIGCRDSVKLNTIYCRGECYIDNIIVKPASCSGDSTYEAVIYCYHEHLPDEYFDLYINGELYDSFPYAALPIHFEDMAWGGGPIDSVEMCDRDASDCCISYTYDVPVCLTTAVRNINNTAGIEIHPNPASDQIIISADRELENVLVTLFSTGGRQVGNWTCSGGTCVLDISNLREGVYLINFRSHDLNYTRKLVKTL